MDIQKSIKVVRSSGCDATWGNVFLTGSWTLYIDRTNQQHDAAMARLGIDPYDVLISGSFNMHRLGFRSSPGLDRREITEDEAMKLIAAVKEIVNTTP